MKNTKKEKKLLMLLELFLLLAFCLEQRRPYEILYSTVMTSPNLTENQITLVVHSLLPIDREQLAREIVTDHQRLNGGHPNPQYELELYRTGIHYRLGIVFDTLFCNGDGQIVPEAELF